MPRAKELMLTEDNPYTRLSLVQKRYVEARLQGLTQKASAEAANAPPSQTYQLERNPKVRAAIRYLIRESTKDVNELTKSDVLTGMMDAVAAAATAGELVMAWREVGKLLGVYEPERKIMEVRDYSKEELKELTDADLLQLAGGKMKDVIDADFEEV